MGVDPAPRDDRWSAGFGPRAVPSAASGRHEAGSVLEQGGTAAQLWGPLMTVDAIETAVRQHRRRLKATGIKFW